MSKDTPLRWRIKKKDEIRFVTSAFFMAVGCFVLILLFTRGPLTQPLKRKSRVVTGDSQQKPDKTVAAGSSRFAEKMLGLLDTSENFTVFAPSDAALIQLSSIFRKFEEKEDEVHTCF